LIILSAADTAMKLKSNLIAPGRVISGRDGDGIVMFDPVLRPVAQLDDSGLPNRISPSRLQSPPCFVESDAGLEDLVNDPLGLGRGMRRPELLERRFNAADGRRP
jgi:hypothetical protein